MSQKPHLAALVPGPITAEKIAYLFFKLTGKTTTPERLEEIRQDLAKHAAARAAEKEAAKQAGTELTTRITES